MSSSRWLSSGGDGHEGNQETVLLVLCGALLVGLMSARLMVQSPVDLPYTVLLFVSGVGLALIDESLKSNGSYVDSDMHLSIRAWANINPHLVLYVFLPTLIFESAYNINSHVFRVEIVQILTLAVPGVIMCTILTAVCIRYLPFGIEDWNACLMMGSMLSATDPVAVVALMRELGASIQLGTLIEGESLLNDGTSIVIFNCFKEALTGEEDRSAGEVGAYFFQMSIGGVLVGYGMAILLASMLCRIYNDFIGEITACLAVVYLTFYVAEACPTSGVLALVALGLYMSAKGRAYVEPSVEHVMDHYWELQAHFANTIVFFVSGIIVVERGINNDEGSNGWTDIGWLLVLYILLHLIRFAMLVILAGCATIFTLGPVKRVLGGDGNLGYGFDRRQLVAVGYGGLRGAVGLCLAMIVEEDKSIDDTVRSTSIFLMSGIAMLTLVVNGTTMKPLLGLMGLTHIDDIRKEAFEETCDLIDEQVVTEMIEELEHNRFLADVNNQTGLASVFQYMPVLTKNAYAQRLQRVALLADMAEISPRLQSRWKRYEQKFRDGDGDGADVDEKARADSLATSNPLTEDAAAAQHSQQPRCTFYSSHRFDGSFDKTSVRAQRQLAWLRARYIRALKTEILVLVEDGFLDAVRSRILVEMADHQLDQDLAHEELDTFTYLKDISHDRVIKMLSSQLFNSCLNCRVVRPLFKAYIHERLADMFELMTGFVLSHEHALHNIMSTANVDHHRPLGPQNPILDQLQREVHSNTKAFESFTEPFFRNFPSVVQSIKTKVAARILLARQREKVEGLHHQGILDDSEHDELIEALNTSLVKLGSHPPSNRELTKKQFVLVQPFLRDLDIRAAEALARHATDRYYESGKVIMEEGAPSTNWLLVAQGNVSCSSLHNPAAPYITGANSVIGAIGVLTHKERQCTVTAHSFVHGYIWSAEETAHLIAQHPALNVALWQTAAGLMMTASPMFESMTVVDFSRLIRQGKLKGPGAELSGPSVASKKSGQFNLMRRGSTREPTTVPLRVSTASGRGRNSNASTFSDGEDDHTCVLAVSHPAILLNGQIQLVNADAEWLEPFCLIEPKTYLFQANAIVLEIAALSNTPIEQRQKPDGYPTARRRSTNWDASFIGIETSRRMMGGGGAVPTATSILRRSLNGLPTPALPSPRTTETPTMPPKSSIVMFADEAESIGDGVELAQSDLTLSDVILSSEAAHSTRETELLVEETHAV